MCADYILYTWEGSDPEIDCKQYRYPNMGEHDAWL